MVPNKAFIFYGHQGYIYAFLKLTKGITLRCMVMRKAIKGIIFQKFQIL